MVSAQHGRLWFYGTSQSALFTLKRGTNLPVSLDPADPPEMVLVWGVQKLWIMAAYCRAQGKVRWHFVVQTEAERNQSKNSSKEGAPEPRQGVGHVPL